MQIYKIEISSIAKRIELPHHNILTSRHFGKHAKDAILALIKELPSGSCSEFSFLGIEICDVSFVDEIVIEIQLFLRNNEKENLIFISNVHEEILENLEAAIGYREDKKNERVPILYYQNDTFQIIGKLEPNLVETFETLLLRKEITAREISEINNIAINNASNKLKKLYDYRLVLRHETIDSEGRQHIYTIPTI